jgi:glycine betaine/proline transport system substrate-binding protein
MLVMSLVMVLSLSACSEEPDTIIIGEGNWESNLLHDQIVKTIIEKGYGETVELINAETSFLIAGFKTNDIDVSLELWSDNILTYDEDLAAGNYVELGTNYDDNQQGIYIPTYLLEVAPDLKTIEDLKNYAYLFPDPEDPSMGIIYGGPEGWGATIFLHKKMVEYGLDEYYNFKTFDSNDILSATLSSAYEKGEPWVGYNWEPTWIMGLFDMTLLEDSEYSPENFEAGIGSFATVDVTVGATNEFIEEYPEITEFLKQYHTSSSLTSEGLAYMQANEVEAEEAAIWFLKEHEDLWKEWVTEEAYNNVMDAIS